MGQQRVGSEHGTSGIRQTFHRHLHRLGDRHLLGCPFYPASIELFGAIADAVGSFYLGSSSPNLPRWSIGWTESDAIAGLDPSRLLVCEARSDFPSNISDRIGNSRGCDRQGRAWAT